MSHYKFTLAVENQQREGYVTEKLFDALDAGEGGPTGRVGVPLGDARVPVGQWRKEPRFVPSLTGVTPRAVLPLPLSVPPMPCSVITCSSRHGLPRM